MKMQIFFRPCFVFSILMIASVTSYPYNVDSEEVQISHDNTSGDGEILNDDDGVSGDGELSREDDHVSGDGEISNSDNHVVFIGDGIIDGDGEILHGNGNPDGLSSTSNTDVVVDNSKSLLPPPSNIKETVILIKKRLRVDQLLYIRGGNPNATGCTDSQNPANDPCAIPIMHIFRGAIFDKHTMASVSQSQGDKYLSWAARERHQLQAAKGTPAVLTTNGLFSHLSPLSIFGPDYWVTMFNMDCSATFNGFFEVKGYYEGQLETDVTSVPCLGFAAGVPPSRSSRGGHLVRCGYQNVIEWGKPDCLISDIPSEYRLK